SARSDPETLLPSGGRWDSNRISGCACGLLLQISAAVRATPAALPAGQTVPRLNRPGSRSPHRPRFLADSYFARSRVGRTPQPPAGPSETLPRWKETEKCRLAGTAVSILPPPAGRPA